MILEDATFEAFGYHSCDLKPHSQKPVLAACDECGKVREIGKNGYHVLCRSCVKKGARHPMYGKSFTEDHKRKMRENHAKMNGMDCPLWRGGISFEPYCFKFNASFKSNIRKQFNNVCFLCGKMEEENGKALSVHHVNYNKQCGCDGSKCVCVPLCASCHAMTNGNRKHWENFITNKLKGTV